MRHPILAAAICIVLALPTESVIAQTELIPKSDYEAGVSMHERGNLKMAIIFFEQGVAKGDPKSMFALGTYYHFGEGVAQDLPKARDLLERASAAGLAEADTMLGIIYREGQGVPKDASRAVSLLRKASKACSDSAQELLAQMLYDGEGVAKDQTEALAYLYVASKIPANQRARAGVAHVERELNATQREAARALAADFEKVAQCPK